MTRVNELAPRTIEFNEETPERTSPPTLIVQRTYSVGQIALVSLALFLSFGPSLAEAGIGGRHGTRGSVDWILLPLAFFFYALSLAIWNRIHDHYGGRGGYSRANLVCSSAISSPGRLL